MGLKKTRKQISYADLTRILEVIYEKSYIKKPNGRGALDFDLARPFLKEQGVEDYILFVDKIPFPLNSKRNIYAPHNLILRNLDIELECNLDWDQNFVWVGDWPWIKWHFEHCRFKPSSPNMLNICFRWRGDFRFYNNKFDFGDSKGMRSWLFVFASGSSVLFQRNDFQDSSLQIPYVVETSPDVRELSWEKRKAYIVRDDSYYEAMIRKRYELPETVHLEIPDASLRRLGINRISFLGNKGIDRLQLRCKADYYIFTGINCINYLNFNELDSNFMDLTSIYFSSRERIDPNFDDSFHHKKLFLSMRDFGIKKQDVGLVNALDKQLHRIEYFLTKEQKIPFRVTGSEWLEYWQDRMLYAWRKWSSDYYRSWFRPLLIGVLGYVVLNAFPWIWIEEFTVSDWIAFSLRRIDRLPFYTAGLKELHESVYESLSQGSKNWLRFIGLFQLVWVTMWGFAFSKSIRR